MKSKNNEWWISPEEHVAPLVGAWIEIKQGIPLTVLLWTVAPLVGAWIEIHPRSTDKKRLLGSLPLWERGLKWTLLLWFAG